jgi:putative transcriptional regulator
MKEITLSIRAETAFKEAGFYTSKLCNSRPSCFDFAARRDNQLIFVKAYANIRNASLLGSCELKTITGYLSGACVYVSEKSRDKPLEDDTVYSRYGIFAVTQKTLEDMLLRKAYPLVRASPGGYYVKLNGDLIRERRRKLGLSIGKISEMTGLSRRTLYGYEKNMGKASVSVAYKLEWIMGVPLVEPLDIFQTSLENKGFLAAARKFIRKHLTTHPIVRKLLQLNFSVVHTKRAPFDFIAKIPKEKLRIVGGIVHRKEKGADLRVEEILSLSKIVDAQPILITEKRIHPSDSVPVVSEEEIRKMEKPEELIQKL